MKKKREQFVKTVRLFDDDKDDFVQFMTKCAVPLTTKGKPVQASVIIRELIRAQLLAIRNSGGTMIHGLTNEPVRVVM